MSVLELDRDQLGRLFPAFIETDADLRLVAIGPSLQRLALPDLVGAPMDARLRIVRPVGEVALESWAEQGVHIQVELILENLALHGVALKLGSGFLFCLSHAATRPHQLLEKGLRMADFSPADGGLALALALQVQDELLAETRQLIGEVGQARDAALAGLRAKSSFLANMSHEIRTPLNGVTGVAGALARTKLSAKQQDLLGVIQASASTLSRMLNDVLDVSQAESGQLAVRKAAFDLRSAIEDALYPLRMQAQEKALSFSLTFDLGAHEQVVADATRLKQILVSLVSNAVKFTRQGQVEVSVAVEETSDPSLSLRLRVADTGVGFDADDIEALYAPFGQQAGQTGSAFGGLGLGLSIAKSLCDLMGGRIEASSQLGVGSVFQVSLPVSPPAPDSVVEAAAPQAPPGGYDAYGTFDAPPLRVLLAEDHPTNQTVVRLILEPHNVDLTIVSDGLEALERYRSGAFDLILVDMRMPGLSGLELTSAVRSMEFEGVTPRTPIIVVSAEALAEHREAALAAGADHYVAKPFTPESLLEAMDIVLSSADPVIEL